MEESLSFLIKEETISDYKCDNCKEKVELVKNMLINDLPNVLILHLKRIIFDIESL